MATMILTWRLTIAYHGANFFGYQIQKDVRTVEGELRKAIEVFAQGDVEMKAAGRTDGGVHAMGQVVRARFASRVSERKMVLALGANLPKDVACVDAKIVDENFCAKRDSIGKRYRYELRTRTARNPFEDDRVWHLRGQIDVARMKHASKYFLGEHDFEAFRSTQCDAPHAYRSIWKVDVNRDGDRISIDVRGNAFCRNMVRIIVGTLVDVGKQRIGQDEIPEILATRDRKRAGVTAPAKGLYLDEVYYPHNVAGAEIPEGARFPGWPLAN